MTDKELLRKIKTSEGCSIFEGASVKGHASIHYKGSTCIAARVVYTLTKGDIPGGLEVLHTCDNGMCIKPEHLYAGTQEQNVRDAVNAGGFGTSKLNRQAVVDILKRHYVEKERDASIARYYKVSQTAITQIVKGRHYPDIFNEVISGTNLEGLAQQLFTIHREVRASAAI